MRRSLGIPEILLGWFVLLSFISIFTALAGASAFCVYAVWAYSDLSVFWNLGISLAFGVLAVGFSYPLCELARDLLCE